MSVNWTREGLPSLKDKKLEEVSRACRETIYQGVDVKLSVGAGHISLDVHDQANIDTMMSAIQGGATGWPYHLDGQEVQIFPAADCRAVYEAAKGHIVRETSYCSMVKVWIGREADPEKLAKIVYGAKLPKDLQKQLDELLKAAAGARV